jgi:hypothetical protein
MCAIVVMQLGVSSAVASPETHSASVGRDRRPSWDSRREFPWNGDVLRGPSASNAMLTEVPKTGAHPRGKNLVRTDLSLVLRRTTLLTFEFENAAAVEFENATAERATRSQGLNRVWWFRLILPRSSRSR